MRRDAGTILMAAAVFWLAVSGARAAGVCDFHGACSATSRIPAGLFGIGAWAEETIPLKWTAGVDVIFDDHVIPLAADEGHVLPWVSSVIPLASAGEPAGPVSIPEPAISLIGALGVAALLLVRRGG